MRIGGCYFFTNYKDRAKKYTLESLNIFSEIGDKNRVAQLTVNLSGNMLLSNQYKSGIDMCNRGIKISEELEDKLTLSGAHMNLAYIYAVLGKDENSVNI